MPFPPGVGGGWATGDTPSNTENFEVITTDRAIDEKNVGNRMLRSMGWQEGLVPPSLWFLKEITAYIDAEIFISIYELFNCFLVYIILK